MSASPQAHLGWQGGQVGTQVLLWREPRSRNLDKHSVDLSINHATQQRSLRQREGPARASLAGWWSAVRAWACTTNGLPAVAGSAGRPGMGLPAGQQARGPPPAADAT